MLTQKLFLKLFSRMLGMNTFLLSNPNAVWKHLIELDIERDAYSTLSSRKRNGSMPNV